MDVNQLRKAIADRWEALALDAINGGAKPPPQTTLAFRNGRFVTLAVRDGKAVEEEPRRFWGIIKQGPIT